MKKKIYDILFAAQYEGITTKEATNQLLVLFDVVGQSEQLFKLRCNCVNGIDDEVCRNSGICKYCS